MAQSEETSKKKPGPKSRYTIEYGLRICEIVATSDIGTATLCATHPEMPPAQTLREWRFKFPEFGEAFKKAKIHQADFLAESIEDIASEKFFFTDDKGNKRVDPAFVNDKRLRVDTRKWIAAKLLPKAYGDKQIIEQTTSENAELKAELAALRAQLAEKNKSEY